MLEKYRPRNDTWVFKIFVQANERVNGGLSYFEAILMDSKTKKKKTCVDVRMCTNQLSNKRMEKKWQTGTKVQLCKLKPTMVYFLVLFYPLVWPSPSYEVILRENCTKRGIKRGRELI